MNQSYKDIITIIQRHGPITTGGICEHLEFLGYGGGMKWQDFRDTVAKQLSYLKTLRAVTGEDRPQPKGKPLRYWALAESQPEEMASDVAEIEATHKENLTVALENLTITPEPVSVDVKVAHKPPISVLIGLDGFMRSETGDKPDAHSFMAGIAFAEKHHGIGQ